MKIPFFHYTYLDNLTAIISDGRISSRASLTSAGKKFTDISIDPKQPVRDDLGLLNYIPMFPGFYSKYRGAELNDYLRLHYDEPKVQNKSFYGSLNKVLQFKPNTKYEEVITLLVKESLIYDFADRGKVRFFSNIAVKPSVEEEMISNRRELKAYLEKHTSGTDTACEIDTLDDGNTSIAFPSEIEAIIVDNESVKQKVDGILGTASGQGRVSNIFVSSLPRNKPR